MSKSVLALVWMAGPLSGTLIQPYVGIMSDNCRHKWGRRRPFIAGGALVTSAALVILSWTREIVASCLLLFGVSTGSPAGSAACQVFAIALVYLLDFAINTGEICRKTFLRNASC